MAVSQSSGKNFLVGEPKGPIFEVPKNTTTTRIVAGQFLELSGSLCKYLGTNTDYAKFRGIALSTSPSGTSTKVQVLFPNPIDVLRLPINTGTSLDPYSPCMMNATTSGTVSGGDTVTHLLQSSSTDTIFLVLKPATTTDMYVEGVMIMETLTINRN